MITVKYGQLKASIESIEKLIDLDLSIKTAIKLTKITNKISEELEIKDSVSKKIEEKYLPYDDEGEIIFNDDEKSQYTPTDPESRYKEIVELNNEEITIDYKKIKVDEFGDVKMKPKDIMPIEWLLDIE